MSQTEAYQPDPPSAGVAASAGADDSRMSRAVEEYLALAAAGRKPSRGEFLARYPDLAPVLEECLGALDFLHSAAPHLSQAASGPARAQVDLDPAATLGDFRIAGEVGRGGMGVVYEAEQISLRRRVALKVLPFASTLDARHLQRFKNEAHAAAQMHHTNIVPVYATGCDRGVHYYAMQFIEGHTLAAVIRQLRCLAGKEQAEPAPLPPAASDALAAAFRKPPAPAAETQVEMPEAVATAQSLRSTAFFETIARLGIQVAEALDHAHELGIVHRDIKPANLLVDTHWNVWVTDFGLAQIQNDTRLTMTGDLLGTLRYMSPEQALAQRVIVDHRTDVYSLGVTLYELLTLEPAFDGQDRQAVLRQIAFEEPRAPRKVNRSIPAELETIVLKAVEKDPGSRYGTAREFADDLRRYVLHEPLRARRPSLVHRARKWVRRHRSLVYSATACLLAAALIIAGSVGWIVRDREHRRVEAEGRVVEALEVAEPLLRAGNPRHPELVSAARKADAQLAGPSINPELEQRVHRLRSDLAMLAALEQARLERSAIPEKRADLPRGGEASALILTGTCRACHPTFDFQRGGEAYAQAFRDYGIDVQVLAPGLAEASMRARTISLHLATALDDWAWLMLAEGKKNEAAHLLAVARQVDPDEWRNRLRAALESDDGNRLEDLARGAPVDRLPAATLITLGTNLEGRGMHRQAAEFLTRVQPRFSGDFWINHDLGLALMLASPGRLDEAVGYLRTAIALRPQSPGARVNLAYALKAGGRLDEAIAAYQEAVRLKPDYGAARWNLGAALTSRGRPQEAIAQFQEAIRIHPNDGGYYLALGEALEKAGRLEDAVAAFEEAIRLSPDNPYAYTSLGFSLLRKGRRAEALRSTRKGLAIQEARLAKSPGNAGQRHHLAGMQCNVAISLTGRGEHAEAESLLRRAVETETQLLAESPTNRDYRDYLANIYVTLGNVYSALEKHAEAEAALRNALAHRKQLAAEFPTNAEYRTRLASIHARLAEALTARKQHQEAETHYSEAVAILKQVVADSPRTPGYRFDLADILHDHARALQAQDKAAEAQAECDQAMSLLKQLVAEFPSVDNYGKLLADCRKVWLSKWNLSVFVPANPDILKGAAGVTFGPDRNGDGVKDLYVAGRDRDNVVVYDGKTGAFIEELVGPASGLKNPVWLLIGPNGDLFTSTNTPSGTQPPRDRDAVLRVDQKTKAVTKFVAKDNPGGSGGLLGATGMAFGPDSHFYVASRDTNQVLRFDGSTGRFLDVFVAADSGGLAEPTQVLFGPDRNNDKISDLYVSSRGTNEVLVYSGKDGSPLGAFVAAGSGGLVRPQDMVFGPDGHLYVINLVGKDTKVYRFDGASGAIMDVVIPGGLGESWLGFDSQGDLYVSNLAEHEVLRYRKPAR